VRVEGGAGLSFMCFWMVVWVSSVMEAASFACVWASITAECMFLMREAMSVTRLSMELRPSVRLSVWVLTVEPTLMNCPKGSARVSITQLACKSMSSLSRRMAMALTTLAPSARRSGVI